MIESNLVSIIVPAYNCETTIARCIDSLKKQIYTNTEIIIVDDGSTDNTAEVVNSIIAIISFFSYIKFCVLLAKRATKMKRSESKGTLEKRDR